MTGLIPLETSESAEPLEESNFEAATDDVAAVRALIVRTHADAVPELIGGATIAELIASIAPAREAWARIVAQAGAATAAAPVVPAGGATTAPIDPAKLSAPEKIRRGLAAR